MDNAGLVARLEGLAQAYPEEIFSEVTVDERAWLHAERLGLQDRIAASMGRHFSPFVAEAAQALATAEAEIARLTREVDVGDTVAQQLQGRIADLTIRLEDAEAALAETRAMLSGAVEACARVAEDKTNTKVFRARMVIAAAIRARCTLTKIKEAGHVAG